MSKRFVIFVFSKVHTEKATLPAILLEKGSKYSILFAVTKVGGNGGGGRVSDE